MRKNCNFDDFLLLQVKQNLKEEADTDDAGTEDADDDSAAGFNVSR